MPFSPLGYEQGLQLEQQRQNSVLQQEQLRQLMLIRGQQSQAEQQALARAQQTRQGVGQYLGAAYPQAPAPGTPSVPMAHPSAQPFAVPPATPTQPLGRSGIPVPTMPSRVATPGAVPPYQTVQSATPQPPTPAASPQIPGPPSMQQVVDKLREAGVPQDQWMDIIGQVAKTANADFQNQYKMLQLADTRRRLDQQDAGLVLGRDRLSAMEARTAQMGKPKPPSASAMNSFSAQLAKDVDKIDAPMSQGRKLLGLIQSSGVSTATTPQIKTLLTDYLDKVRSTNLQFKNNAVFGNVYQRLYSRLSSFAAGTISDSNKADIVAMINSMNNLVFDPLRDSLTQAYVQRAKVEGIDPSLVTPMADKFNLSKKTAPDSAIGYLKAHPEAAEQFKAKYGYLP